MPTALITGILGQDGSYLAELLLAKGYNVVGLVPPHTAARLPEQRDGHIEIVEADMLSQDSTERILRTYAPNEVYNLAARASSSDLWTDPVLTGEINGLAVTRLLDAIATINPEIRFVQASSSEVFGNPDEEPQNERTRFRPRNPYGAAKAYGHWSTALYREQRNLFACSAILYNHESPRRGFEFVTRKVSRAAAHISLGKEKELRLGSLDARRDWGFAGDYVRAMWLMLQQPYPDDYVVATGETHSVNELCEIAFSHVGLDFRDFVIEDAADHRPPETHQLVGNPERARRVLGWKPTLTFRELVCMMVDSDLQVLRHDERSASHSTSLTNIEHRMAHKDPS